MDISKLKFGEYEEVIAWAQYLDHDAACAILAPGYDNPGPYTAPQPTDWRSYFTTEELREQVADLVMRVCNVPA